MEIDLPVGVNSSEYKLDFELPNGGILFQFNDGTGDILPGDKMDVPSGLTEMPVFFDAEGATGSFEVVVRLHHDDGNGQFLQVDENGKVTSIVNKSADLKETVLNGITDLTKNGAEDLLRSRLDDAIFDPLGDHITELMNELDPTDPDYALHLSYHNSVQDYLETWKEEMVDKAGEIVFELSETTLEHLVPEDGWLAKLLDGTSAVVAGSGVLNELRTLEEGFASIKDNGVFKAALDDARLNLDVEELGDFIKLETLRGFEMDIKVDSSLLPDVDPIITLGVTELNSWDAGELGENRYLGGLKFTAGQFEGKPVGYSLRFEYQKNNPANGGLEYFSAGAFIEID